MKKTLTKKQKDFCLNFAVTNNPREAAASAGYSFPQIAGLKLLEDSKVISQIAKLREQKINTAEIVAGLKRIAFGSVGDSVKLLFGQDFNLQNFEELDLFNVSEIKRGANGTIEVKFFDRQRALEKLLEVSFTENTEQGSSFLDAILKGSRALKEVESGDEL